MHGQLVIYLFMEINTTMACCSHKNRNKLFTSFASNWASQILKHLKTNVELISFCKDSIWPIINLLILQNRCYYIHIEKYYFLKHAFLDDMNRNTLIDYFFRASSWSNKTKYLFVKRLEGGSMSVRLVMPMFKLWFDKKKVQTLIQ